MTVEQRDVLVLLPTREQLRLAVGVSAGDQGAERGESGWAEHGRGPWGPCGACVSR